jgi:hypothetical protein
MSAVGHLISTAYSKYMVFQKYIYNDIRDVTVRRVLRKRLDW